MHPHMKGREGSEYRLAISSLMLANKVRCPHTPCLPFARQLTVVATSTRRPDSGRQHVFEQDMG